MSDTPDRTAQELFNDSYLGLMAQGMRCIGNDGVCSYLNNKGQGCAVGILIADHDLRRKMDLSPMTALNSNIFGGVRKMLPTEFEPHIDLLVAMQKAHDCTDEKVSNKDSTVSTVCSKLFRKNFKFRMQQVATKHGLTMPQYK